jgi:hypothetical protein
MLDPDADDAAMAVMLAEVPLGDQLEALDLSLSNLTRAGAERLAAGRFPRLRSLDVSGNDLDAPASGSGGASSASSRAPSATATSTRATPPSASSLSCRACRR